MTAAAANFSGAIGVGGNAPANANLRGWFAGATNKNIYIGYGGTNAIIQGLSDNLAAYAAIDIDASSLRLNSASGGLVGIGMTPSNVLDITQNQNGASVIKLLNNSAGANAQAVVQLSDGTNNAYMAFFGTGGAGTGPNNPGSFSIQTQATGGMNIATTAAYPMKFHINNAEAARITPSSTSFLIGKTAKGIAFAGFQANYSTGQTDVTVSGSECMNICRTTSYGSVIRFFQTDAATLCGSIATSAGATAYNTSSDYRLKENVQPMTGGLDTIATLKPVTYDWIIDKSAGEGFIAHELQAVIPAAVHGEKDAVNDKGEIKPQGVDFGKIVPHLVAAMQEQQATIQELTTRLAALEAK
jgi:hypothetical protein